MSSEQNVSKDRLADFLRKYPTWGHAACAEQDKGDEARKLLLEIEGAILGYWTNMPESVLEEFRVRIRNLLGACEPA